VFHLKVRKVGNSLGVTLPAEAARMLHVREGDALYLTETPDGFRVTGYDPEFETTMKAAEGFMARYRNALRTLSK
jgi:putative addiction module antidote